MPLRLPPRVSHGCTGAASRHVHPAPRAAHSAHASRRPRLASGATRAASTRVHCAAASRWLRWAHVATVCFMRFRCMLHMFHLDVAKVDLVLYMLQVYVLNVSAISNVCCKCFIWILPMLQWLYMYVTNVCSKCFTYFIPMLQMFHLDVAYVSDICCKYLFKMFHLF